MVYTEAQKLVVEQFVKIYTGSSMEKGKRVSLFELVAEGDPKSCAIQISKKETELYQHLHLKGKIYTLFAGPMIYEDGKMKVRLGIATGVHRR